MRLSETGEFGLIDRLARKLAARAVEPAAGAVRIGIGDDAAVLEPPPGTELVATLDAMVEEVHFRREWSRSEDLGWKALAVNVSDLGGMGARPLAALVTLALPAETDVKWVERVYAGLAECSAEYGCPVVGGDTVRSPRGVVLSVAALGTVRAGSAALRSGARPGELLCVTGVLGDSGAGLALLERGARRERRHAPLYEAHLRPRPPVTAGVALTEAGLATAMLDLSDGLASDVRHLARRSGVGVRIEAARLPISDTARQAGTEVGVDPVEWALHGGEDYQLLFTVGPEHWERVPPTLGPLGVTATVVGRVVARGVTLVHTDGRAGRLEPQGFAHFSPEAARVRRLRCAR